ncbi:MAG: hypothetical protein ICV60_01710 [Pyrinomonadaceae bacterium]|nr:hypothetical protein [Pyrinomonadaceae bacterium]
MSKGLITLAGLALACLLVLGMNTTASAQGRGRGGGGVGRGAGGGGNSGIGGSNSGGGVGVGVGRGIGTSSDRSNGRADNGRGTASDKSNGRSDDGLDRARENSRRADEDLSRHPGIASGVNMSANQLRAAYNVALQTNPNLKFGQFVAATRLSQNLGSRYPNITRDAILAGLASGRSLGQTLRDLGLSSDEARAAERRVKREMEDSRRRQ